MTDVVISHEPRRLCGYRKPAKNGVGIYLTGPAWSELCERLPLPLDRCPTCGAGVKFSRFWTWIQPDKLLAPDLEPVCTCQGAGHSLTCPMCNPGLLAKRPAGLLWVGNRYYTPETFMAEAGQLGIMKKIKAIPKAFELGLTWVYLAHLRVTGYNKLGIFTAFRPKGVDLVIGDAEQVPETAKRLAERIGGRARIVVVKPI